MDEHRYRPDLLIKLQKDFDRGMQKELIKGLRANDAFAKARQICKEAALKREAIDRDFKQFYEVRLEKAKQKILEDWHRPKTRPMPKGMAEAYLSAEQLERLARREVKFDHDRQISTVNRDEDQALREAAGLSPEREHNRQTVRESFNRSREKD